MEVQRRSRVIWLDGEIVPEERARVSLYTHALHYGTAVFDGCRYFAGPDGIVGVFRLDAHLRRFTRSCAAMFFELPFDEAALQRAALELVRRSGFETGYLRLFAWLGDQALGIDADNPVHVALMTWVPRESSRDQLRLRVAGFGHGNGWIPAAKLAGHYARSYLARREARATACDEALFLGHDGSLAEAAGACVLGVWDGVLRTPPLSAPVLGSVTRDTLLVLAREEGIPVEETRVRRDQLLIADELLVANSARGVRPVSMIDGHAIPAPGPVTRALKARYEAVTRGREAHHLDWRTRVE